MPPNECPNCGANVPRKAKACPVCGACENTGWAEEAGYESSHLVEDEFDYDDFVAREFGDGGRPRGKKMHLIWVAVAVFLILFFLTHAW
tara:strand:+ start:860 stop:1126 length:267 start_codon:yes stop_codon:yes gene_type:complete